MSRSESSIARNAGLVGADVLEHALALERVEVRQRDRRAHRVAGEREPVRERVRPRMNGSATRSETITAPIGAYALVSPLAVVMMSGW